MNRLARELRRKQTDTEKRVWHRLRHRQLDGHKFRRQEPIGGYIVDFVCLEAKIIIELDGGQHLEAREYDKKRTNVLERHGYRVLRFWNHEIMQNMDGVLNCIWTAINTPHPDPLPEGEGEPWR